MEGRPRRINGNRKKIARPQKPFLAPPKKEAERQASENEHQNTRNLLNVDSNPNQPTLLYEQSRFNN